MTYAAGTGVEQHYRQLSIQHDIETASPHRLIQMLMERALTKIALAKRNILEERIAEKGSLIGDAINIIAGLQASLNFEADDKLCSNFDALYDYMSRRLLESNLRNDPAGLDEVASLMGELKSAWDAISPQDEVPAEA